MIKNAGRAVASVVLILGCESLRPQPPPGFQGVVELEETVLAFDAPGRVERIAVREGDRVAADTIVAKLDDALVRATRATRLLEVEAARSASDLVRAGAKRDDLAALEAAVRAARATEALLEKNAERQRRLFESKAVPEASVDDLEGQLSRARAERESAESRLASLRVGARREERAGAAVRTEVAEATLQLENERLARHELRAPGEARVLDVHVELGEVVAAGAPVVTLGDTRRPYVDVFVPQNALAGLGVGRAARVRVDAQATAFQGRVEHVARRTEFTPRFLFSERERPNLVVRVRVRVDDAGERLHAGVPAFVTFEGSR